LAYIETADELLQVHEDADRASEDLKGVSTEIHRIEVDVHDGNITSKDDSTRNSSNLSDIRGVQQGQRHCRELMESL